MVTARPHADRRGAGTGPGAPGMLDSIETPLPARDLLRRRKRYFIGLLVANEVAACVVLP